MQSNKYDITGSTQRFQRKRSSSVPLLVYYKNGESVTDEYYCSGNYRRRSTLAADELEDQPLNYYNKLKYNFNTKVKDRLMSKLSSDEFSIKKSMFLFVLDWVSDIASGLYYFLTTRWIEGTLTWLIVFGSGILITFGFLNDKENRKFLRGEAIKYGKVSFIFLYCPSLFPFFCHLIRLRLTSIKNNLVEADTETEERLDKIEDLSLKSMWSETVFEAKPQLLLQILLLLETSVSYVSPFDYLPICTSIISLFTATNAIYTFVLVTKHAECASISSKTSFIWGLSYTGVSVTAPAFSTNILRNQFESPGYKFLITVTSLIGYFIVFEIIYELCYLVSKRLNISFSRCYYLVLPVFYLCCFLIWFVFQMNYSLRGFVIISIIFVGLLVVNCVSYYLSHEFSELCFKMKNDKIDTVFNDIKRKFGS